MSNLNFLRTRSTFDNHVLFLVCLFAIAFFLRLYTANIIPYLGDEKDKVEIQRNVSFQKLPLADTLIKNPLGTVYISKLGFMLFGAEKVAGRFFFVLLGP